MFVESEILFASSSLMRRYLRWGKRGVIIEERSVDHWGERELFGWAFSAVMREEEEEREGQFASPAKCRCCCVGSVGDGRGGLNDAMQPRWV